MGRQQVICLDTHAWLWWAADRSKLPAKVTRRLESAPALGISAISCWELGMLVERGRLKLRGGARNGIHEALGIDKLRVIPVSESIAIDAGLLGSQFHGDPADRFIVATARELAAVLVTKDEKIRASKLVPTLW